MTARCKDRAALVGLTIDEAHAIIGGARSNVATELGKRGLGTRDCVVYDRVAEQRAALADLEARRSALPTEPCFMCGARGFCRHRHPDVLPDPSSPFGRAPMAALAHHGRGHVSGEGA